MLAVVRDHAASMLRVARKHSLCADDAQDAYQRALLVYIERADRIDPTGAGPYLRTVVKHEAMAIRETRLRALPYHEVDYDTYESATPEPHERAESFDRVTRAAEALRGCKRDEIVALLLSAQGNSYAEIAAVTGWSRTKVNRCLTEGRARFRSGFASIETGDACRRWMPVLVALVDGEARTEDLAGARAHLRNCPGCRVALRELYEAPRAVAALAPVGLAPAGLLAGAQRSGEGWGVLARAWDAAAAALGRVCEDVVGLAGDRAAAATVKLQSASEAVVSGKLAAVAASAAVLAGGGVAAESVLEPERGRAALERQPVARGTAAARAVARDTSSAGRAAGAARAASARGARSAAAGGSGPRRARGRRRSATVEFGIEGTAAARRAVASTNSAARTGSGGRERALRPGAQGERSAAAPEFGPEA